jgi:hypothetical protein
MMRRVVSYVTVLGLGGLVAGCPASPRPHSGSHSPAATQSSTAAPAATASIGTLRRVADMSAPRAVHTATRLPDGRILVAGGCTTNSCDLGSPAGATAEIFDPATMTFTPTGRLSLSRDDHAAVAMSDGRVLLIGGWSLGGILASTDRYDPRSGTFAPGPTMHSPRAGLLPVTLSNGQILLAGGFVGNKPTTAAADLYDPATDAMLRTGELTTPRGAYAAARLPDGRVLFAGGLDNGIVVASAEIYDPVTGTFLRTGAMRTARYKGGAVALADGSVMVFGGSGDIDGTILYASTEIYHPVTGTFSPGPAMHLPRYKVADSSARLGSGDVLVTGGASRPEVFRAATGTFEFVGGDLGATRLFIAAAAIDDHRVLITGGYDKAIRPTAAAWVYDDRAQ